jgi:hypothetical protein
MANEYRIYEMNLEVAASFASTVYLRATGVEVLQTVPASTAFLRAIGAEVLGTVDPSTAELRAVGIEVLRAIEEGVPVPTVRRRQPMVESF